MTTALSYPDYPAFPDEAIWSQVVAKLPAVSGGSTLRQPVAELNSDSYPDKNPDIVSGLLNGCAKNPINRTRPVV